MTNEEAKRRLEVWLKCMDCPEDKQCYDSHLHSTCEYTDYCDETPVSEAVKVAIKALEQQPCDAISREAALEKMADYVASGYADSAEDFEEYSRIICQLPSVTTMRDATPEEQKSVSDYIKSISTPTEVKFDDAISRQAVLDLINADWKYEGLEEPISSSPPVTPQQKYGKWIFVDKAKEHAYCSECNYGNVDLFDGRPHNYCPNCGCRMVESQESEEE